MASSFIKQRTEIALNNYYYYYYYVCVNNCYFQIVVSIKLSDITFKISTVTTCVIASF